MVYRFECGANRLESQSKHASFDPIQALALRHALQPMSAPILEADSGLLHQIFDRARDQDFAAARFRGHSGADVKDAPDRLQGKRRAAARKA